MGPCSPNTTENPSGGWGGDSEIGLQRPGKGRLLKLWAPALGAAQCRAIDRSMVPGALVPCLTEAQAGSDPVCAFQDARPGWEQPGSATICNRLAKSDSSSKAREARPTLVR